jgi:hypothetical protein
MFDALQQPEIRGRFHQHRIAGLTQHAQGQGNRVHRAAGDDDMLGIGWRAGHSHALGHLTSQLRIAGRHDDFACVIRPVAQHFAREIVQSLVRIQRWRNERTVERHDVLAAHGLATGIEHLRGNRDRAARACELDARLGRRLHVRPAYIEARLRSSLDQADVLQMYVRLYDGRYADFRRTAHAAHGRDALVRAQCSGGNLTFHQVSDTFVKQRRLRSHDCSSDFNCIG